MNEEGYHICKVCNGSGKVTITIIDYCITTRVPMNNSIVCVCKDCGGNGKLDWISNVKKDKALHVYSKVNFGYGKDITRTFYPSKLVLKVKPWKKITLETYRNVLGE
jgi:hypothetical protein